MKIHESLLLHRLYEVWYKCRSATRGSGSLFPLVIIKFICGNNAPTEARWGGCARLHGASILVFQGTIWKTKAVDLWQRLLPSCELPRNWSELHTLESPIWSLPAPVPHAHSQKGSVQCPLSS